jgi:dTDP-D-glucose 4,6-dehydratase
MCRLALEICNRKPTEEIFVVDCIHTEVNFAAVSRVDRLIFDPEAFISTNTYAAATVPVNSCSASKTSSNSLAQAYVHDYNL